MEENLEKNKKELFRRKDVYMIIQNGYRKIKFCIEQEVELNEYMSDSEIDEYLSSISDGKDVRWCDADEELFD